MKDKLTWIILTNNVLAFLFLQPCRNQFRQLKVHSWKAWFLTYMFLGASWGYKMFIDPDMDKVFFLLFVDTILIVLQTLLYYICYDEEVDPSGRSFMKWRIWAIIVGYIPKHHGRKPKTDSKSFEE